MKNHITIEGHDGAFDAYIAKPKTVPAPAVTVLQELFGVNADIRKHCYELAEQGFLAVAPDLFWRQEPGVDLSVTSEPTAPVPASRRSSRPTCRRGRRARRTPWSGLRARSLLRAW